MEFVLSNMRPEMLLLSTTDSEGWFDGARNWVQEGAGFKKENLEGRQLGIHADLK
jgi:hypothetical protein